MNMKKNTRSYGKENDLNLKLLIALSRGTQAVHKRSGRLFEKHGLTTAQFSVLETLYHKGDMTISEIMNTILSTPGNMTVVIRNLLKENLVERNDNPKDKRSALVGITDKGREIVEIIFPLHLLDLEDCFKRLSETDKENMVELLKNMTGKKKTDDK